MMVSTPPTVSTRRLVIIACQLFLLGTLGACSAEGIQQSDSSTETATLAPPQSSDQGTTSQPVNERSYSLNDVLEAQSRDPAVLPLTVFEVLSEQSAAEPDSANASENPATRPANVIEAAPVDTPGIIPEPVQEPVQEPAQEPAPEPLAMPDPASTDAPEAGPEQVVFRSTRTPGFTGEVLDNGSVRVNWATDPTARGYNVYRQASYIATVFTTEYIDEDVFDGNYYYEIQAFDYDSRFTYVAKGLTVKVSGTGRKDPDQAPSNSELLQDYSLIFEDDFNGSSLDTSKWNTSFIWGPDLIINQEEQYYVDIANDPDFGFNPFTFDGQAMTIKTVRTPASLLSKANDQPYLSGIITSRDALKFTYGYAEARARVPYGRGYWPAFWLLNAYYDVGGDWPEIDIMEFIGSDEDVVYHTYHYFDENQVLQSTKSEPTAGIDFTADFHTFAVEWKPGALVYYVDGRIVHRVNSPQVSSEDMYLIANTAVGGWWAGSPDQTTPFPGQYELDYIRVYQKTGPFEDGIFNDAIQQTPIRQNTGQTSPGHRLPFDPSLILR